jgi:hypothetical protein
MAARAWTTAPETAPVEATCQRGPGRRGGSAGGSASRTLCAGKHAVEEARQEMAAQDSASDLGEEGGQRLVRVFRELLARRQPASARPVLELQATRRAEQRTLRLTKGAAPGEVRGQAPLMHSDAALDADGHARRVGHGLEQRAGALGVDLATRGAFQRWAKA